MVYHRKKGLMSEPVEHQTIPCWGGGGKKVCGGRGSFEPIFRTPPPGIAPVTSC